MSSTDATTADGFRVGRRVRCRYGDGVLLGYVGLGVWHVNLDSMLDRSDWTRLPQEALELLPDDEPDAPATPEPDHSVDANKMVEPASEEDVRHQSHYAGLAVEPIDAIRAWLTPEEFRGYCKGSVIAYYARERLKGGDRDCLKAEVYAAWLAEAIKGSKTA